jgi:hypothetical protein
MARPPKLHGDIPTVTADWQWSGVWPVTTPAAMTGAWQLPTESRAVLLLVNVSDRPITGRLEFDAGECGIVTDQIRVTVFTAGETEQVFTAERNCRREVTLPPGTATAWELEPLRVD